MQSYAKSLSPGARVLDAGAGDQPYKDLFSHCTYEAADFEMVDKPYARSTYVCDLARIPVEDGRFDAIVLNQVMEHLPNPAIVLGELNRVLKPGGKMICSAPLFFEEHEQPYDFFRYTQWAWRHLLGEAGFQVDSVHWLEGYFATVAYQLETASRYLPTSPGEVSPGAMGWLALPVVLGSKLAFRATAALYYALDERRRYTARGFPKNYLVTATKLSA